MIHITNKSEQGPQTVTQTGKPNMTYTMTNDSTDLLLSASLNDAHAFVVAIF